MEEKCEDLSNIMPFMFKKKGTYLDILFPTGLLMENSLLVRLREEIGEEATRNQEVQKATTAAQGI